MLTTREAPQLESNVRRENAATVSLDFGHASRFLTALSPRKKDYEQYIENKCIPCNLSTMFGDRTHLIYYLYKFMYSEK